MNKKLPEEHVRNSFIQFLAKSKGFPISLMAKEKSLSELPYLKGIRVPDRRLDLLVFYKKGGVLHPLLLVECKANKNLHPFTSQIIGYNYFVKAPYCCLVNEKEILFYAGEEFQEVKDVPSYAFLVNGVIGMESRCTEEGSNL